MKLVIAILVAALCFVVDQASKWWVLDVLDLRSEAEIDVTAYLDFVLAFNKGVNFGLFASGDPSQQWLLAGFAVAISAALLVWSWMTPDWRIASACGLVIGGALGNALDRVTEGAVVDFINLECCGIENPYAFNVADTTIFLGAALLAILAWRDEKVETRPDAGGDGEAETSK